MLLNSVEEQKLVSKIAEIERKADVEIHIHICSKAVRPEPIEAARAVFQKLKMDQTSLHTGILFYVAEKSHDLACIGDSVVNEKFGEAFWKQLVDDQISYFKKGDYFIGFLKALEEVEKKALEYFPNKSSDNSNKGNSIADEISRS